LSNHARKAALTALVYTGGSRDPATLWIFSCKNTTFGCIYHHHFYSQVLEHQRNCKIISAEAFAALNEVKTFPCDRDGCGKSFETKAGSPIMWQKCMMGTACLQEARL
jgi:hypothetical protein